MSIQDLVGDFSIVGSNQDGEPYNYKGTLNLSLDHHNRIKARWLINENQVQIGHGFFKDNILVINFHYTGENHQTFHGVVVYKCLSKNVFEGFWSEEYGDPQYLGSEQCTRMDIANNTLN
ncbi:hypothetical protein F6U93_04825 [Tamlana haliotis]|uniref:Uncharacterized protein n=1 Tax=Pseudotamlana haliotis TaxID=2614804 RepID=A0A6N6ME93_9FLAO|nr:hypothetical protein [Tamlana haliotis]KAB1069080.1 hypothetical protein F6U93_04825 [Tamlana haliotis]